MKCLTIDDHLAVEFALLTEAVQPGEVMLCLQSGGAVDPKMQHQSQHLIEHWVRQNRGSIFLQEGGYFLCKIPRTTSLKKLQTQLLRETGQSFYAGLGANAALAEKALTVACHEKSEKILCYNPLVEQKFSTVRLAAEGISLVEEATSVEPKADSANGAEEVDGFELTPLDLHSMKMIQRGEAVTTQDLDWLVECKVVEKTADGRFQLTVLGQEILG